MPRIILSERRSQHSRISRIRSLLWGVLVVSACGQDLTLAEFLDLGIAGDYHFIATAGDLLVFHVSERQAGEDLNADGDLDDFVVHAHQFETGETRNLEVSGVVRAGVWIWGSWGGSEEALREGWIPLWASEVENGARDLNRDGDVVDQGLYLYNFASGDAEFLSMDHWSSTGTWAWADETVVFSVDERKRGEDLDGDGDVDDSVLHAYDLASGTLRNLEARGWVECQFGARIVAAIGDRDAPEDPELFLLGDDQSLERLGVRGRMSYSEGLMSERWAVVGGSEGLRVVDLATRRVAILGLSSFGSPMLHERWLVVAACESSACGAPNEGRSVDMNGDGDMEDRVIHVRDLESGVTVNTGIEGSLPVNPRKGYASAIPSNDGPWFAFLGGRDSWNARLYFFNPQTQERIDSGTRAHAHPDMDRHPDNFAVSPGRFGFVTPPGNDAGCPDDEDSEDGCAPVTSYRTRVYDISERTVNELGEGDGIDVWREWVIFGGRYARHLASQEVRDLGAIEGFSHGELIGNHLIFLIRETEEDVNGDGDVDDTILHVGHMEDLLPEVDLRRDGFLRADSNHDAAVNVSDVVFTLAWLFTGGPEPDCLAAANANGDASVNVADPSFLLNHLFLGGPPMPGPFPECGTSDVAADEELDCEESACP